MLVDYRPKSIPAPFYFIIFKETLTLFVICPE